MKTVLIIFFVGCIALFVVFYVAGCAMWASFNMAEWDNEGRVILFSFWIMFLIPVIAMAAEKDGGIQ